MQAGPMWSLLVLQPMQDIWLGAGSSLLSGPSAYELRQRFFDRMLKSLQ